LLIATAVASFAGVSIRPFGLLALALIGLGLFLAWLETSQPLRVLRNVFFHPQRSWMTRESLAAVALLPLGFAAVWLTSTTLISLAAISALGFLYCQGQILKAAKGIPVWRTERIVSLIMVTGLTEGVGLYLVVSRALNSWLTPVAVYEALWLVTIAAVVRGILWMAYRRVVELDAPTLARDALAKAHSKTILVGLGLPLAVLAVAVIFPAITLRHLGSLAAVAGLGAVAGGWYMKFIIVLRAAFNQGYSIERTPQRGTGGGGRGIKPGWA
jgi:phenylacetyl-CoA:acceptor oxidoreductase subunit 2